MTSLRPTAFLLVLSMLTACGSVVQSTVVQISPAPSEPEASTTTAAPVPTNAPNSGTWGPYGGTAVPVGVYFIDHGGLRYTFKIPASGWWTNNYPAFLAIGKVHGDNGPMTRLFILSDDGGAVFADACHWTGTASVPGVTVDDLVAALLAVKGFESSKPSDTTVGGYRSKHLRLTVPADVNVAACDEGEYQGYPGFQDISPGRVQDFWVFDADGTRHLVWSAFDGNTPAEAQAELTELFNSLGIKPTTP